MAEYEFSKEELEEIVIIACLNNLQVLSKAASLPEDIFKDEYLRWVFIKIKKFYKKYRKLIKKNILMSELEDEIEDKKQPIYTQVVNELYNYEMDDLNIDWEDIFQKPVKFVPGKIEIQVAQMPSVEINYVGGPIYFPRSNDPNYEPFFDEQV